MDKNKFAIPFQGTTLQQCLLAERKRIDANFFCYQLPLQYIQIFQANSKSASSICDNRQDSNSKSKIKRGYRTAPFTKAFAHVYHNDECSLQNSL